ncbi:MULTISPECIES: alpha/beta hydrolase [Streptomyces]|uniref:alpha/beta hydrolase n=1 Tax=Streptomyces TaxID=1883 RepID=UPI000CD5BF70|nr:MULTISPECIES: alpha/beta fold hydrolase [Streptomyces]
MTPSPAAATDYPVVLIHGLWMTPHSWQGWIDRYTERGYRVHAPAWPGVSALDEELDHDRAPEGIGVQEVADHLEQFVGGLDAPPLIIGHSFGGLLTQILLDRGYGRAGVALHSAPPRGVLRLPPSVLRASWPVLRNPANRHRAVPLTEAEFHYAFANTRSAERSAEVRARLAIPAPGRPLFQVAFANVTPAARAASHVDFRNGRRAPLLLLSGEQDHIVTPSMVRENHRRYRRSGAVTDYREFPGRDHLVAASTGWEEIADHALSWAEPHLPAVRR